MTSGARASSRLYPERPIVGVGAVIVEAGRVVLIKRRFEPLAGQWSLPGGTLELGETLERDHPQFVEPLLLRDVYGLSDDEIAQLVDAPLGTVKAQIHHGRKLVRPLLREGE